jgi:hypothetical protein
MASMDAPAVLAHRPRVVLAIIGLLVFLGVSALGGGVGLISGWAAPPDAWLDRIPLITNWLVPGLVLGLGFGVGSLATAFGMLSRSPWSWLGAVERLTRHRWPWASAVLIGAGQVGWITLELVYLPQASALQAIYGTNGLLVLVAPVLPAARRYFALSSARA